MRTQSPAVGCMHHVAVLPIGAPADLLAATGCYGMLLFNVVGLSTHVASSTACCLRAAGEKFETFWDDELQQWRYKDARRLDAAEASRCRSHSHCTPAARDSHALVSLDRKEK